MKRFSKIIALFLALALLTSGCGSNPASYGKTVAATYGDRVVYLDEANFWLRYAQMGYSYYIQVYQQWGVTDFWGMSSGNRTQTMEEYMKENVMSEFLQTFILLDHAGEYDTTLTDSDNKKIDEFIAELHEHYNDSLFDESVVVFSDEKLRESLVDRTKALKVWQGVRQQATTSVSDEDAKSFSVNYFQITASSSITADDKSTLGGEELAKYLTDKLVGGVAFSELKAAFTSLTSGTLSYRWNDEDTKTRPQNRLGRVLTDGQVTWQKDGDSWYVVQCISADDKDAAVKAKAELESAQMEEHFNQVYAEWAKAAKNFSVKSAYNRLQMIITK